MFKRFSTYLAIVLSCASIGAYSAAARPLAHAAPAQEARPSSPSRTPTTLLETYESWSVHCATLNGKRHCEMGRAEVNAQGQPLITMQLSLTNNNVATGAVLVPFGVLVTEPIEMQVDTKKGTLLEGHIRSCVPQGCIVPISLDANAQKVLGSSKLLHVNLKADGVVPPDREHISVHLTGFAEALDRLRALK